MKAYLALISALALSLSACGGESKQAPTPPAPTPPAASTPAPVAPSTPAPAETSAPVATSEPVSTSAPAECAITVNSDDAMKFDTQEISFKSSCKEITLTLAHTGKAPKAAMGHNIVIAQASDKDGVLKDAMAAGASADFFKADDTRVVAATKMIGGGEQDTITVDVSKFKKDGDYAFFCTFPGHAAMMSGKVKIVD